MSEKIPDKNINASGYICIVGGANIDIQSFPEKLSRFKDSNPWKVRISLDGVGRNMGENLSRMGIVVKLISAVGNDDNGKKILDAARSIGLDTSDSKIVLEKSTSNPDMSVKNIESKMEEVKTC